MRRQAECSVIQGPARASPQGAALGAGIVKLPVSESAKFLFKSPCAHLAQTLLRSGLNLTFSSIPDGESIFNDGIAFLKMELPKRHATSLAGSRFAPLVLSRVPLACVLSTGA